MNNARDFKGYNGIFAMRLREIMESSKTTQEILAKQTGLTRQTISQYMDGSVLPNVEKLYRICGYFDVPSDYLIGSTNSKSRIVSDQRIQDITGLEDNAIDNIKMEFRKSTQKLFDTHDSPINLLNYVLSKPNFISEFHKKLWSYFLERCNKELEVAKRPHSSAGLSDDLDLVDMTRYSFAKYMEQIADDCYDNFYKPLGNRTEKKLKPGRKRKDDTLENSGTGE